MQNKKVEIEKAMELFVSDSNTWHIFDLFQK